MNKFVIRPMQRISLKGWTQEDLDLFIEHIEGVEDIRVRSKFSRYDLTLTKAFMELSGNGVVLNGVYKRDIYEDGEDVTQQALDFLASLKTPEEEYITTESPYTEVSNVFQLADKVLQGEKLFTKYQDEEYELFITTKGNLSGKFKNGSKYLSQQRLGTLFSELSFYTKEEKKVEWWEKLDGTKENGVWCWVYDGDKQHNRVGFVTSFEEGINYPYDTIPTSICTTSAMYRYAEPIPKELSDKFSELEEEIKKLKERV